MAAVTQAITNYLGGVSRQSDQKKLPGQVRECLNALPDPTFGLRKRPGTKFIKEIVDKASGSTFTSTNAKWFYIDNTTDGQKYIGHIDGQTVRVWNTDGTACEVNPVTFDGNAPLTTYLGSGNKYYDYDVLTVQATSIITNKNKVIEPEDAPTYVANKGTVFLTQVKYSTSYAVTINVDGTLYSPTAHVTINSTSETTSDVELTNTAKSILSAVKTQIEATDLPGTMTVTLLPSSLELSFETPTVTKTPTANGGGSGSNATYTNVATTVSKSKILTLGTPGAADTDRTEGTYTIGTSDYTTSGTGSDATFSVAVNSSGAATVTLVDAGKNFAAAENITIPDNKLGSGGGDDLVVPVATIGNGSGLKVDVKVEGNVATEITVNSIDAGKNYFKDDEITIAKALVGNTTNDVKTTISGFTDKAFTLKAIENQGNVAMLAYNEQVSDITKIPDQSVNDRAVKIMNTLASQSSYWTKFVADDGTSGTGFWEETVDPSVSPGLKGETMPHELVNTDVNKFNFQQALTTDGTQSAWANRAVGDETTNAHPSFVFKNAAGNYAGTIQQAFFHNNRLGFLTEDNVSMSQTNQFYNLYHTSALTASDSDPIDLNCTSIRPASLHGVIPTAQGLILFSKNQQFIMFSDSEILTPASAIIRGISNYEMDDQIDPVDVGTTINFVSKTPSYTRVFNIATRGSEESPIVDDVGKIVAEWIPAEIDNLISSPQNSMIALYGRTSPDIYFHKTYNVGDRQVMKSWFKWTMPGDVQFVTIDSDIMWIIVKSGSNHILLKANVSKATDEDVLQTADGQQINPHMDLYKPASSVKYKEVKTLAVSAGGSGYTGVPTVTISAPSDPNGVTATATATIGGGAVTGFTITNSGSGYTAVPSVTISGGSGSNAAGTATIEPFDGSKCYIPFSDITTLDPVILIKGTSGFTVSPNRDESEVASDAGGTYFKIPKLNFSGSASDVYVGYQYNYDVELPKTYFKLNPEGTIYDYPASLTIARMKFAVGLSSGIGFKMKRKGYIGPKDTFTGDSTNGTDGTDAFKVPFPLKKESGVVVKVNGDEKVAGTHYNYTSTDDQGTVTFTSGNVPLGTIAAGTSNNNTETPAESIEITTDTWFDVQPVQDANQYLADDVPLTEQAVFTIPVHQKTDNFTLRVFSNSPFPVSLSSMMWEGNYSPRFYRRT